MPPIGEERPLPQNVPETIARLLRHEVGDLLQTVYAAVAILKERLPPEYQTERRILTDMPARAETCRDLLDTVHDLVCPITLSLENTDFADVVKSVAGRLGARFPRVTLRLDIGAVPVIHADPRRLAQLATILLADACSSANSTVVCRVAPGPGAGEVTIEIGDDGPIVPPEKEGRLFNMMTTTAHGHLGPGLALAAAWSRCTAGASAGNRPEGGFRVEATFPPKPPLAA